MKKEMTMSRYQDKAMTTCTESSDNFTYALCGLIAEVGEVNDKVAKWRRKGIADIRDNKLVFTTSSESEVTFYRNELLKEVGDIVWFCALLSRQLGSDIGEVAKMNIDKLRDRAIRNVIIGEGDNR